MGGNKQRQQWGENEVVREGRGRPWEAEMGEGCNERGDAGGGPAHRRTHKQGGRGDTGSSGKMKEGRKE